MTFMADIWPNFQVKMETKIPVKEINLLIAEMK